MVKFQPELWVFAVPVTVKNIVMNIGEAAVNPR